MSKSLIELRYSILEAVSNFFWNDDFPITESWLDDQIITQNNTLIRKALTERRIDEQLYMIDEPLEMKPLKEKIDYKGITINVKEDFCYVDMKPLVSGLGGLEIDFVSNLGMDIIYVRKAPREIIIGDTGYYELAKPTYAVFREFLLFRKDRIANAKFVLVNAIWRDPRQVSSWDENDAFPTPSEKNLEILTIQHIGHAMGFPPDLMNDAQRAMGQPAKQKQREDS